MLLTGVAPEIEYGASVPAAPTSFAVSASEMIFGNYRFSWVEPAGTITLYTVEKSLAGAESWSSFGTVAGPATGVDITAVGLTADTNYDFRVKATNAVGQGPASSTLTKYSPKVYDAFTGAADTDLTAHTADIGTTYTKNMITGALFWELDGSGAARQDITGAAGYNNAVQTGLADATTRIRVRLTTGATDAATFGACCRYFDTDEYYYFGINYSANRLEVYEATAGGGFASIATLAITTPAPGATWWDFYLTANGTGAGASTLGQVGGSTASVTMDLHATRTLTGPMTISGANAGYMEMSDFVQSRYAI